MTLTRIGTWPPPVLRSSMCVVLAMLTLSGCQSDSSFYDARNMPRSLRIAATQNAQKVDLARLQAVGGDSDEIGPGDFLEVSIAVSLKKDDQVVVPARVGNDGTANIPNVGKIRLAGEVPQTAELIIARELINLGIYRNPAVTVHVAHKKMNRISVVGAVETPQVVELPPNSSDVVSAIAAAGGLAENASADVTIRNPRDTSARPRRPAVAGGLSAPFTTVSDEQEVESEPGPYTFNLVSATQTGAVPEMIQDGGVVMVNKHDPEPISVTGLVRDSGSFDYTTDKPPTVLGAIALAGGRSNQLADKVFVIRPTSQSGQKAVIQVSLRRAKRNPKEDLVLGPGDIVSVEQTPATVMLEAFQLIRFGISGSAGLF